jgi:methyltransferase (TIGR00027 family)
LGAGFESFAFRRRDLAGALRIFEVDHPATQQRKQARLGELRMEIPPNLTFVPLDFEERSILEGLEGTGYRRDKPAFFSWFGVTVYLTEDAIVRTLKDVVSSARGGELVFDYVKSEALLDEKERQTFSMIKSATAAFGEPAGTCFEPARMTALVKELGFTHVWDLDPEQANALYLANRTDGLQVTTLIHLLKARIDHMGEA